MLLPVVLQDGRGTLGRGDDQVVPPPLALQTRRPPLTSVAAQVLHLEALRPRQPPLQQDLLLLRRLFRGRLLVLVIGLILALGRPLLDALEGALDEVDC